MIASLPDLMAPETRANPYPLYARLRAEQPVARVDPGGLYAVSRYDDVVAVLRDAQAFSSAAFRAMYAPPWLPKNPVAFSLVTADPPEHTRLRGLVSRAFEPRAIARLEPRARAISAMLLDGLGDRDEIEYVAEIAAPLPAYLISEILGLDPALHKEFKRWGDALGNITPMTPPELFDKIRANVAEMEGYLREVIAARRAAPRSDLVSDLLAADAAGQRLSDAEVLAMLFLIMPAGFETSTHMLSHGARALSAHPELLASLRASPSLIPAFVEEVMRHESPVHAILRVAAVDTVVAGTRIPAGSMVATLLGSANRDERRFSNPDRFDINREAGKSMGFGHGIHFCIGAALARLEARVLFEELVRRYDHIAVVPGPLSWSYTFTVRGPTALPLRLRRSA